MFEVYHFLKILGTFNSKIYPGKLLFITGSVIFGIGNFELYSSKSMGNQMVSKANMLSDCTI